MKRFSRLGLFTLTIALAILLILPAAQAVDFKISGQINRAALWGDNGNDSDTKFVDNDNSSTRFRFTGGNDFTDMWRVGIVWEVEMQSNASNDTDIDIGENDDTSDVDFNERKIEFYVDHKKFGRLWLGQGDTASNGTSEVDLSGTDVVNYSSIEDMAGGFRFRDDDDNIITSIGSAFSNFDGFSRRDRARYDTPKFGPVYFSASYMNGQSWDLAGRFSYEWDGVGKLAAAAHYTGADNQRDPYKQWSGSASWLFDFGLNFTASYGARDDVEDRNEDPYNLYGKVGYKFGKWALSVDYTYSEHVGADDDEATSIGTAVVWNVWESVQFYGSYRWHDLDRDQDQRDPGVGQAEDIHAVMIGGRVKF
ncbi:MAG: porin [Desulfobacterales bacterium]|nr:porin [Desulfobacterales bacterium]